MSIFDICIECGEEFDAEGCFECGYCWDCCECDYDPRPDTFAEFADSNPEWDE